MAGRGGDPRADIDEDMGKIEVDNQSGNVFFSYL